MSNDKQENKQNYDNQQNNELMNQAKGTLSKVLDVVDKTNDFVLGAGLELPPVVNLSIKFFKNENKTLDSKSSILSMTDHICGGLNSFTSGSTQVFIIGKTGTITMSQIPHPVIGPLMGGIAGYSIAPYAEKRGEEIGRIVEKGCRSTLDYTDKRTNDVVNHLNSNLGDYLNEKLDKVVNFVGKNIKRGVNILDKLNQSIDYVNTKLSNNPAEAIQEQDSTIFTHSKITSIEKYLKSCEEKNEKQIITAQQQNKKEKSIEVSDNAKLLCSVSFFQSTASTTTTLNNLEKYHTEVSKLIPNHSGSNDPSSLENLIKSVEQSSHSVKHEITSFSHNTQLSMFSKESRQTHYFNSTITPSFYEANRDYLFSLYTHAPVTKNYFSFFGSDKDGGYGKNSCPPGSDCFSSSNSNCHDSNSSKCESSLSFN